MPYEGTIQSCNGPTRGNYRREADAEPEAMGAAEGAEQLAAVEAVRGAVGDWEAQLAAEEAVWEAMAGGEAEAERKEMLAAREAAAREEATATPDG